MYEKTKVEEIQNLLDSDKNPKELFDWIGGTYNGFRVIRFNNRENYIDENNKLLSDKWFDWCQDFSDNFGVIQLYGKYNYIKPNGQLLSNIWFDWCFPFTNKFGEVELNGKEYRIDKNGKIKKIPYYHKLKSKLKIFIRNLKVKIIYYKYKYNKK